MMKKFFALALFAVMALTASAQFYMGGTLNAWRDNNDKKTLVTIEPEIGYDFSEKLAVGGTLDWDYVHRSGSNTNKFSINPYVRYTFVEFGPVGLFVDGTAGVGFGKTTYKGGGSSDTAVMWQAGFRPGIKIEICDHVNIESHIGFLGYKGVNDAGRAADYENGWGLRFSSENITIGACYEF